MFWGYINTTGRMRTEFLRQGAKEIKDSGMLPEVNVMTRKPLL